MKLGAQLYSLRTSLQNEVDMKETFQKVKAMGYENVQLSGAAQLPAQVIREASLESGLPIVCTHVPYKRFLEETDEIIREHKIFGSPVLGIGMMPTPFHGTREGFETFVKETEEPIKKILDAGLRFAYHNHDFEFKTLDDGTENLFDEMLERLPHWQIILDTYWVEYAGKSAVEYVNRIAPERLENVHFKDMAKDEKRSICSCGAGVMDFASLSEACRKVGVKNVLVEQDNAPSFPDPFEEMASSFRYLRPIVK